MASLGDASRPGPISLHTPRLTLRPSGPADFARAFQIRSNWEVARNLSMAQFPPDAGHMAAWFDGHGAEWIAGTAYRFAVQREERVVGLVDISDINDGVGELGYWLDRQDWGQGFAFEAAQCVLNFAFEQIGLSALIAGHVADNQASAHVLVKLGFVTTGEMTIFSRSRGTEIRQVRLRLGSPLI